MKFTEQMLAAPLPEDIQKLKWYGDFETACRVIEKRLKKEIPEALKERLRAELVILKSLPEQYPYTWDEAFAIMQETFRDFTREEFQSLWEEDAMDWIYVYGKVQFRSNFLSNLIVTRSGLWERMKDPEPAQERRRSADFLNRTISYMKEHDGIHCRFQIRSTLKLQEAAEKEGQPVKVYLPIPVEYAQVKAFRLLDAGVEEADGTFCRLPVMRIPENAFACGSQEVAWIAPSDAHQRTVCLTGPYRRGSRFRIEYEYEIKMPYVDLSAAGCGRGKGWIPEEEKDFPEHYLGEQLPHIHRTPYLKAITAEIVGEETEPVKKAKRIYDYITSHLMYSYMRNYFAITELVDYAAAGWKGDCGIQALLFINMCRIAGVPARWQSGLYAKPGDVGSHDWAMFYAEPYGWLYADCSFGGSANRMNDQERREFYFGNLDPFRMPSCCQFQADFQPPVQGLRHDPYDNQSGEVEYGEECLAASAFDTVHEMVDWKILE